MGSKIKQIISNYLREDHRISVKLSIAMHTLMQCRNPLAQIRKIIKKTSQPIRMFRICILIHECYLNSILECSGTIQLLTLIRTLTSTKTTSIQNSQLDQLIYNKVINPYVLYLQKCYQVQQEVNLQSYFSTQELLYRYFNLLKSGLSIVEILYTFGRYFKHKYEFIIDFNIILGKDFNILYQNKIKYLLKKDKTLWTQEMKLQIQKLHQNMYIVYYNCYFYKWLRLYVPKWIDTQNSNTNKRSRSVTADKTNRNRTFNFGINNSLTRTSFKQDIRLSSSTYNMNHSSILQEKDRNTKSIVKMKNQFIMATQISVSVICQTRPSPEDYQTNKQSMMNSTISYTHGKHNQKYNKQSRYMRERRKQQNLSMSQTYVSDLTCDDSNKKQQYVINQMQGENQFEYIPQYESENQEQPQASCKNSSILHQKGTKNCKSQYKLERKANKHCQLYVNEIQDPFSLLESMERVVQRIDMNISKLQDINLNASHKSQHNSNKYNSKQPHPSLHPTQNSFKFMIC